MKKILTTPPVYYPLILDQVKSHLNIDYDDDDAYLQSIIAVATGKAEQITRRRLITQTWTVYLDAWPAGDSISLPFGNLASVTHVKYTDTAGTQTTWSDDYYNVDTYGDLGRIVLEYGYNWPTTTLNPNNPIEIQFVCGYGANAVQAITGASNASPIVLTIGTHGHATGDEVYIYDVGGNTAADGNWIITKADVNSFNLNGSAGNAAWTSGGSCIKQSVDPLIIHAIKIILGDLHEHREDQIVGTDQTANLKVARDLLWMKRIHEEPTE